MKNCKGFTLIELSIVILLSGMSFVMVLSFWEKFTEDERIDTTINESLLFSEQALQEFAISEFGVGADPRYPCPADPELGPDDANYGVEQCIPGGGVKRVEGRDVDGDGTRETVLIGAVPFQTILNQIKPAGQPFISNIDFEASHAYDGWGHKVKYAVTENLTNIATFNANGGAIYISDPDGDPASEDLRSIITPTGSAHAVLISHGANALGAYTENGEIVDDCEVILLPGDPVPPFNSSEEENCDDIDAEFALGIANTNPGAYYDDYVEPVRFSLSGIWDINTDNELYTAIAGYLGLGTDSPAEQLHIDGSASTRNLEAGELCDQNGTLCMNPEVISGDIFAECPDGQVMTGVSNNAPICETLNYNIGNKSCTPAEFVAGVSNLGNLVCCNLAVPTNCHIR